MNLKTKLIILSINVALCLSIALGTYFFMGGWGVAVKVVCYSIAGVGFVFGLITFFLDKQALFKSAFVLVVFAAITVAAIAAISKAGGLDKYPTDAEKIKRLAEIIKASGGWGIAVYFLIQVLQVVILPLPAAVCYIPGSYIWKPWQATLIASAGVLVGSVICYFIGKFFGKRAVVWIAGRENTEKYSAYFSKRGKVLFVLMQILPFFPDDILCMVVGLTGMNFWFFLGTIVLVRPIIIAMYCYLGSGTVIPFKGWGIPVWIAIFAVCIALAVLSFKYQDRVEAWLVKKLARRKNKCTENIEDAQVPFEQSEEDGVPVSEEAQPHVEEDESCSKDDPPPNAE